MSFFKTLKSVFKGNKREGKGYILGDNNDNSEVTEKLLSDSFEYSVIFEKQVLGCQIGKGLDHCSYIVNTDDGSQAELYGVKRGDKIISIDGNEVNSHDDFVSILQSLGRPITIK
jgi:S1-C subfamily serine protease